MNFLQALGAWVFDPSNWTGPAGVPTRLVEHVQLSAISVLLAAVIAIPAGVVMGHVRRGGLLAVAIVNIGRAVPSFAVVALALPLSIKLGLGLGFWPTFVALVALAVPGMFTNSYAAIIEVPRDITEAATAMGMKRPTLIRRIQLPLALPVIFASVRVSAVQVVATATLGALVAWGGLGRFIIDGFRQQDYAEAFVGAILVATLAIATELVLGFVERLVSPAGVRRLSRAPGSPEAPKLQV